MLNGALCHTNVDGQLSLYANETANYFVNGSFPHRLYQTGSAISAKTVSSVLHTGIWYYTGYIDSSSVTKKIYDYSGTCASFAYEITIDKNHPDSCYFKGYHEEMMLPLKRIDDKTYRAGGDSTQYWILTFPTPSTMTMKKIDSL